MELVLETNTVQYHLKKKKVKNLSLGRRKTGQVSLASGLGPETPCGFANIQHQVWFV